MTPAEISELIAAEVGDDWSISNDHGVDLKRCLVTPTKRVFEDSWHEGQTIELWLVLEESPEDGLGYKIVFDEERGEFGLAVSSKKGRDVFLNFSESFIGALEGM